MSGIDFNTYKGVAGAGGTITLARPANSLALSAQGTSVFWVRPRGPTDSVTAPTLSPAPGNNAYAAGWIRVSASENPPSGGKTGNAPPFINSLRVAALEVWCDTDGSAPFLAVIATT